VDDTYIFSNNVEGLSFAKTVFQSEFPIQNSDPSNYLGIHIEKIISINNISSFKLTQPKLISEIIEEFKPKNTSTSQKYLLPINKLYNYNSDKLQDNVLPTTITYHDYMHLVGKLNFLLKSRPDIKLAVSYAATKSTTHTNNDYKNMLDIVSYLSETTDLGLTLYKHIGNPLTIYCYVDASYLLHSDSMSHSGFTISFGPTGSFISKSKKQKLIATSSMHAEARAVYLLIQTLINIYVILIELQLPIQLPITVFEDNEALIYSTTNSTVKNKKCRHFIMLVNFIKEQVQHNLIQFYKVSSIQNTADLLAKPTIGSDFQNKRNKLGVL
jgi:hypothetical protein